MKKTKRTRRTRQNPKLTLAKESVRTLATPDLSNIAGGNAHGHTVTFPFCCRTA